jgi:hypothetical protein
MVDLRETGSYDGLWVELIQIHVHWRDLIVGCWTFQFLIQGDCLKLSYVLELCFWVFRSLPVTKWEVFVVLFILMCSIMVSSTWKPEVWAGRRAQWRTSRKEMPLVAWTVLFVLCDITVPPSHSLTAFSQHSCGGHPLRALLLVNSVCFVSISSILTVVGTHFVLVRVEYWQ